MEKLKLYIDGQWLEGREYEGLRSPYNQEVIAQIPLADNADVEAAISSAQKAATIMRNMTTLERSEILERVAELFQEKQEECALILAKENAKPLKSARAEILRTIETYKFASEEAKRIHGETIPLDAAKGGKGRFGYTKREPLGVIGAITPFNFPFNLTAHKLGPAFAAGNTVVLKPASQTPLSAFMTAKIFEEAGLPKGALNVITGKGRAIGDLIVTDPRVKMITFTGSVPVGMGIKNKSGLKRVTLELGSNAAVIVDSVSDLDSTVARCVEGSFNFAGQVCISVQRIYVRQDLFNTFVEKMIEYTKLLVLGDPRCEETDVSALIHPGETDRIESWVAEAEKAGATIAYGGKREGAVFQPTIIVNGGKDLSISCNEAFGPIVVVNSYDKWDEAINFVNDSDYGLQAGVYTTNIQKAFDAVERLEVGGVIINDIPSFRVDHMPYGGVKNSGVGKEGVKYSTEEMTELKFVSFKL
ncbi:aldehyde dehydrogenase [Bacillus canaveralius]|uniref:Aldehyde dehydrogenase n=1 Tax=Bacillus canaveralius TaxID=1403243 RepID=A0A2N5GMA1_9BACI|nr:aldehyde dehydrogenase family protein [Bacillus canaveralius]PLR82986.1 aldehyde dehydrogenase [Bacillus canaveralius]PLR97010.1 aldehyde dehydrogenase [Bacillus canaveralius]